jgi:prolyl 4-hydroxylase
MTLQRTNLICGKAPNFIGSWFLDEPSLCEAIIDFFEQNNSRQVEGTTVHGVDKSKKNSTEIKIDPKDLLDPTHSMLVTYVHDLHACYLDYLQQWPFLGAMLKEVDIGTFHIQRYDPGGHFRAVHTERASAYTLHRVLVWMTYLNTVEEGGRTNFSHYGLDVKPERGLTLIWPAEWTHAHAGQVVTSGSKYVITGWFTFPLVSEAEQVVLA